MPRRRNNNQRRGTPRGGRGQARYTNLPQRAPSGMNHTMISQPGTYPLVCVTRLVEGLFNVITDGINPALYAFQFSLQDVPGNAEMTAMFQTFCIEQVEIWWRPEYTVLSDAAAVSNSVNVEFNSAIDVVNSSAPATVDAVLEYQTCAHTSIVSSHYRKLRPAISVDSVIPMCAMVASSQVSANWLGIKVGVPATGIAMTFRSTCKFKIVLGGLK